MPCDVSAEPHVRRLIEAAASITGQIDILVNSAGGAIVAPFQQLTLADWETTLRVGLTSAFLTCKHAAGHYARGRPDRQRGLGGVAADLPWLVGLYRGQARPAGLLRRHPRGAAPRGIRVTVVLPAATDTALWDSIPGEWNRANMLQPEDVGRAIAQLAEQPAYLTTEELVIGHVAGRL